MSTPEKTKQYGTLHWFEKAYATVPFDPWGLTWRPSQQFRYQKAISLLDSVTAPLGHVLDAGCATGDFTYLLSRHIPNLHELVGIDFVDSAVQRARHRFPDISFTTESLFALEHSYRGHFDLITCLELLYYIPIEKRLAALRSLTAALRPKGYILLSSMIAPPPYFSPGQLLTLVSSECEIITYEIVHLRLVSLFEHLFDKSIRVLFRRNTRISGFHRLPLRTVALMERCCRCLGELTASHVIVIARARS